MFQSGPMKLEMAGGRAAVAGPGGIELAGGVGGDAEVTAEGTCARGGVVVPCERREAQAAPSGCAQPATQASAEPSPER